MIKYFICCFTGLYLTLSAVVPSAELLLQHETMLHDQNLQSYLHKFPYNNYEICFVQDLGYFFVDPIPDGIKWHLKRGIYWESGIGELIQKHSVPGSIVIDLGAHIGIHSITMSRKVGADGLVISFEPQYKIYRELCQNLKINQCTNVIPLRVAVGDEHKTITMAAANPTNEGGTPVRDGKFQLYPSGDTAEMITLDSLNLNHVSLIKMDVESYELRVLQGAKETLLRNKPVIIFEILGGVDLDTCSGENLKEYHDIISFVSSLGYNIQRIHGNDFIALPW